MFRGIVIFLLLTLSYALKAQPKLVFSYNFNPPKVEQRDSFSLLQLKGAYNFAASNNVLKPFVPFTFALPAGYEVKKLKISFKNPVFIKLAKPLQTSNSVQPLTNFDSGHTVYNNIIEQKPDLQYKTGKLRGINIVFGAFSPAVYKAKKQTVKFYTQAQVTIYLKPSAQSQSIHNAQWLEEIIDNPEILKTYKQTPSLLDYLIITNQNLIPTVEPLKEIYQNKGYTVKLLTVERILNHFPDPDTAKAIREAIKYFYQNYGLQYVLLGGDISIIPARGFYDRVYSSQIYESDNIPADIYYSGMDGNWNTDNDDLWAEPDEADLMLDVAVGRLPFETTQEAQNMVTKIRYYQLNPINSDLNKYLLLGEYLWYDPETYGATYMNLLIGLQTDSGYVTQGIPPNRHIDSLYDRYQDWSGDDLLNTLQNGYNFIFHCGHSNSSYLMRLYITDVTTENFAQLDGLQHLNPILYTHGCYAGAFDVNDCITEEFLKLPVFTSAVVANSRYGWFNEGQSDGPSEHLNREFVNAIFGLQQLNLGMAQMLSKIRTAPFIDLPDEHEFGATRWVFYDCNLLGDPLQQVWTDTLKSWTFYAPDSISPYDSLIISFNDSVNVCANLWLDSNRIYQWAFSKKINLILPQEINIKPGDSLRLFLCGENLIDTSIWLKVKQPEQPYITASIQNKQLTLDDTIALLVRNLGLAKAQNIYISFSAPNFLPDTSLEIPLLNPQNDTLISLPCRFITLPHDQWFIPVHVNFQWQDSAMNSYQAATSKNIKAAMPLIKPLIDSSFICPNTVPDPVTPLRLINLGSAPAQIALNLSAQTSSFIDTLIEPNDTLPVSISPSNTDKPVENISLSLELKSQAQSLSLDTFSIGFSLRQPDLDFSTANQLNAFAFSGQPWTIETTRHVCNSVKVLQSPELDDDDSAQASINFYADSAGYFAFEYNVMSQKGHDFFKVFLDDRLILKTSGTTNWKFMIWPVDTGNHTVRFVYTKDSEGKFGRDNVMINRIYLPPQNLTVVFDRQNKLKLYPNPVKDKLLISFDSDSVVKLELFNSLGQKLKEINFSRSAILNVSNYPSGSYIIIIRDKNRFYNAKFTKL